MNKLEMKHQSAEIARDAMRQAGITQITSVMGHIPEVLEAMEIDSEYMRSRVETELNKKTGNPLNALLRLLGLRIINTKKATESMGLEDSQSFTVAFDEGDGTMESMLKLNPATLSGVSAAIAAELAEAEQKIRADRMSTREESSRIFSELDKKQQECNQLNADLAGLRATVMERAQYMLSLIGPGDSPIGSQLEEMLEDMGITVYWCHENAPFSGAAMFTELRCDNPSQRRMKPCLADENGVILKGLRFIPKNTD